jgi:hypothetical protein
MATIFDEGSGPLSIAVYADVGAMAVGTVRYAALGVPAAIVGAILGAIGGAFVGAV